MDTSEPSDCSRTTMVLMVGAGVVVVVVVVVAFSLDCCITIIVFSLVLWRPNFPRASAVAASTAWLLVIAGASVVVTRELLEVEAADADAA